MGYNLYIMANNKSSLKRIRQNKVRRLFNKYIYKSTYTFIKKLIKEKNKKYIYIKYLKAISMLDKLSKKNIIHKKKSSKLKKKLYLIMKNKKLKEFNKKRNMFII